MHNIVKRTFLLLFVIVAFLGGTGFLAYEFLVNSKDWVIKTENPHVVVEKDYYINAIYDADGNLLMDTVTEEDENGVENKKLVYVYEDEVIRAATLHAVGNRHFTIGITNLFNGTPVKDEYSFVNGLYDQAKDNTVKNFYLTLNSDVCKTAYQQLNGRKGTVGVYNYKTGEIICMVSSQSFDPNNAPDINDMADGTLFNKFTSQSYAPGSTFKIVTAACAIENMPSIYSRTFTCDGALEVEGFDSKVICNSRGGHGKISFEQALNKSCNCVFAQLAIELGSDRLKYTAEKMGFNQTFEMDRHTLDKGNFDISGMDNLQLGWAGIGQHTNRANPCMMMTLMGAIANGGQAVKPYYIDHTESTEGETVYESQTETVDVIDVQATTANKLKALLRSNVENYYGEWRFPGLQMCGKTGTAEIGQEDQDLNNAWFVGFSQDESMPYAIVVMIAETPDSASDAAIPVANAVMQSIKGG